MNVEVLGTFEADLLAMINADVSLDPDTSIGASTDLVTNGLIDSLGVMEVVDWIEERLGVIVDPTDVLRENFESVDRMVAFAHRLLTTR